MTWAAVLKGRDANLLKDLGPLSDMSVLIFMTDDTVGKCNNTPHGSLCGNCVEGLFSFHSIYISQMSDPCDFR